MGRKQLVIQHPKTPQVAPVPFNRLRRRPWIDLCPSTFDSMLTLARRFHLHLGVPGTRAILHRLLLRRVSSVRLCDANTCIHISQLGMRVL